MSYATYCIRAENGYVVEAPPIAKWMEGKDTQSVRDWIAKKGGTWKVMNV